MKKKVPVVSVAEPEEAARVAGLPLEATIAPGDVTSSIKEGLMAFVSSTGLVVLHQLLQAEMTERIGPKHAKLPDRQANWHGTTTAGWCSADARCPWSDPEGFVAGHAGF